MILRDLISPNLTGEARVQTAILDQRRVFKNDLCEIFFCRYPGLVTALVHYKKEELRIMTRLSDAPTIQEAVDWLQKDGRGPLHLLRDAKLECQLQLTLHDRALLKMAGIDIPRSAGRYREMFKENEG